MLRGRLGACDTTSMVGGTTLGRLADIDATRMIVIHDVWTGYSPHAPVAALYDLRRDPRGRFTGRGWLSTALVSERIVDVSLSAPAAQAFLATLASAAAVEEPYRFEMMWTDDYPHIEIALHVGVRPMGSGPGGFVLLYTQSQGELHAPWGACVDGKLWTLPGEEVGRALAALRRPLKRTTLDRMMREA